MQIKNLTPTVMSLKTLLCILICFYSTPRVHAKTPEKLASLAPSITEMIYSLNAQSQLIGVSSFCDYPGDAKTKPVVGSFTTCNLERMKRLAPDKVLLVTGQEAIANQLKHNSFQTVILPNRTLSDIAQNLITLGEITGQGQLAKTQSDRFEQAVKSLKAICATRTKTTVFLCVFPQPLVSIGKHSYLHEVIETSGGTNIAASAPQDYPHFSMEKLLLSEPEVIIMPYESRESAFFQKAPWAKLKAIKDKRYYFLPAPSKDTLSRPTPRTLEGLFWLASKLHPELSRELSEWQAKWLKPHEHISAQTAQ